MKISKLFNLGKSQYELDFVDIDPDIDAPLFLDPYYISKCDFPFAAEAHRTIRSYFEFLLALLKGKSISRQRNFFSIWARVMTYVWECLQACQVGMGWGLRIPKRFLRNS